MKKKIIRLFALSFLAVSGYGLEAGANEFSLKENLVFVARSCNHLGERIPLRHMNAAKIDLALHFVLRTLQGAQLSNRNIGVFVETSRELNVNGLSSIAPGFYSGNLSACEIARLSTHRNVLRVSRHNHRGVR